MNFEIVEFTMNQTLWKFKQLYKKLTKKYV
jgi:hypothetical protein